MKTNIEQGQMYFNKSLMPEQIYFVYNDGREVQVKVDENKKIMASSPLLLPSERRFAEVQLTFY